jgi:hypothetical protein
LNFLEEKDKKIDIEAKKFIKDDSKKEQKINKIEKKKEEEPDLDPNFDESSLEIYGYMLNEQLEKS